MAVKSIFDIKCFKDVKFWAEQSFLELLPVNVLPYFTHCMEVACWHKEGGGGEDVQQPKNPGPKQSK